MNQIALRNYTTGANGAVSFTLFGPPKSQSRPRFNFRSRRPFNNLSAPLRATKTTIAAMLVANGAVVLGAGGNISEPLFQRNTKLLLQLTFHMPRPRAQLSRRFGFLRVRQNIENLLATWFVRKRVDVDNLSKFIMDAMNGVVYSDDCQVHILIATKVHDNREACLGRTVVTVRTFRPNDFQTYAEGI